MKYVFQARVSGVWLRHSYAEEGVTVITLQGCSALPRADETEHDMSVLFESRLLSLIPRGHDIEQA